MDSSSQDIPINYTGPRSDFGFRSLAKTWGDLNNGKGQFDISEEEWYNAFKFYDGLPDFDQILGNDEFKKWMWTGQLPSDSTVDKIREIIKGAGSKEKKKPVEQVEEVKKKELPKLNAEVEASKVEEVGGDTANFTATATEVKPKEEPTIDLPEPKTEEVNETVLAMIGLKSDDEIGYGALFDRIKKKLVSATLVGNRLPEEEDALLRHELKRIQKLKNTEGDTIRIKIKSTKVKPKTDVPPEKQGGQQSEDPNSSAIVKYKKPNYDVVPISVEDNKEKDKNEGILSEIKQLLDSILNTLKGKFKFDTKKIESERKEKEAKQRGIKESIFEGVGRGIGSIVAVAEKAISPFQSILDKIWRFLFFTLLGKAFSMFVDWMSNEENRKKFNSFVDFLVEHWPALAGIYILFGTGFGKLVRGLLKSIVRMGVALIANIPKIIRFIRANKAAAATALIATAVAGAYIGKEIKDIFENSGESPEGARIPTTPGSNPDLSGAQRSANQLAGTQKIPKLNFGGLIPKMPRFNVGGMNSFMGGDLDQGIPITGAGPDDTLAAVSTGEAILTKKDQDDIGNRYVDRNTGQPLNIPQYLSGRKPGTVSMNNIRPKFGGGFYRGGIIQKYNTGGMVGGGFIPSFNMQGGGPVPVSKTPPRRNGNNGGGGLLSNFPNLSDINPMEMITNILNSVGIGNRPSTPGRPQSQPQSQPTVLPEYKQPEAQALLKVIRFAEHYASTKDPYNVLYGGKTAPVTSLTVKETIDMYDLKRLPKRLGGKPVNYGPGSSATGAYQIMIDKLEELVKNGVVKANQMMVPELQDRLGWYLAKSRGVTLQQLKKTGLTIPILDLLAPEWASIPYSPDGGASYYSGQPSKNAETLIKYYNTTMAGYNKSGGNKKQGGGALSQITNKTGIRVPGAADTQYLPSDGVTVQPGEQIFKYVLTRDAARMGAGQILLNVANSLNSLDGDSDQVARFGRPTNLNRKITPYNSGGGGMITLPPMNLGNGNTGGGARRGRGSSVPSFSAVSPDNDREINAKMYYGIV